MHIKIMTNRRKVKVSSGHTPAPAGVIACPAHKEPHVPPMARTPCVQTEARFAFFLFKSYVPIALKLFKKSRLWHVEHNLRHCLVRPRLPLRPEPQLPRALLVCRLSGSASLSRFLLILGFCTRSSLSLVNSVLTPTPNPASLLLGRALAPLRVQVPGLILKGALNRCPVQARFLFLCEWGPPTFPKPRLRVQSSDSRVSHSCGQSRPTTFMSCTKVTGPGSVQTRSCPGSARPARPRCASAPSGPSPAGGEAAGVGGCCPAHSKRTETALDLSHHCISNNSYMEDAQQVLV